MYRRELYNNRLKSNVEDHVTITVDTYRGWSSVYRRLYEKYLKDGKDIEQSGSDIFETKGWCWFVHCLLSSGLLSNAYWIPGNRQLYLHEDKPDASSSILAPRPAVRRKA